MIAWAGLVERRERWPVDLNFGGRARMLAKGIVSSADHGGTEKATAIRNTHFRGYDLKAKIRGKRHAPLTCRDRNVIQAVLFALRRLSRRARQWVERPQKAGRVGTPRWIAIDVLIEIRWCGHALSL